MQTIIVLSQCGLRKAACGNPVVSQHIGLICHAIRLTTKSRHMDQRDGRVKCTVGQGDRVGAGVWTRLAGGMLGDTCQSTAAQSNGTVAAGNIKIIDLCV